MKLLSKICIFFMFIFLFGCSQFTSKITTTTSQTTTQSTTTTTLKQDIDLSGIKFESKEVVYDGNEHSIFIEGSLPDDVVVEYAGNKQVNAGTYVVIARFSDTHGNDKTLNAKLTILKANITNIKFESKKVAYNGEKHSLEIEGNLPDGVDVFYTNNGKVDVGTYEITASFIDSTGNYNIPNDMTATLTIESQPLEVIFDSNNGSDVKTEIVYFGYKIEYPTVPVRRGYNFIGWYYNDKEWIFYKNIVTDNMTLKAKWEPQEYTIILKEQDKIIDRFNIYYDDYFKLPEIVEEGYLFSWLDENGNEYTYKGPYQYTENKTFYLKRIESESNIEKYPNLRGENFIIYCDNPKLSDPRKNTYNGLYRSEKIAAIDRVQEKYNCNIVYEKYPSNVYDSVTKENWIIENTIAGVPYGHVFEVSSVNIPVLVENDVIIALDDFIDKLQINNYYTDELKNNEMNLEKTYSYSDNVQFNENVLYFNYDLLKEIGYTDDQMPDVLWNKGEWNWTKFKEMIIRINNSFAGTDKYALTGQIYNYALQFIYANGGVLLDNNLYTGINSNEAIEALDFLSEIYHIGDNDWMAFDNETDSNKHFINEKSVFLDAQMWYFIHGDKVGTTDFELHCVPFPYNDKNGTVTYNKAMETYRNVSIKGNTSYVISSAYDYNNIPDGYKDMFLHGELIFQIWNELQYFADYQEVKNNHLKKYENLLYEFESIDAFSSIVDIKNNRLDFTYSLENIVSNTSTEINDSIKKIIIDGFGDAREKTTFIKEKINESIKLKFKNISDNPLPQFNPYLGKTDNIAPILNLKKNSFTLYSGISEFDAFSNISYAFDNVDLSLGVKDVVIDYGGYEGLNSPEGTYTITYKLMDSSGNVTKKTCVLKVVDGSSINGIAYKEYLFEYNYNPIIKSQWSSINIDVDNSSYDTDKVTILSADYFNYLYENVYERISIAWSIVMVTDSQGVVQYVRHYNSYEYYLQDGVLVCEPSLNWSTGTGITGVNDQYISYHQGIMLANIVDYVPNGGYVVIFPNNGTNIDENSPRGFGDNIFYSIDENDFLTYGIGEKLFFVGLPEIYNTPTYITTKDEIIDFEVYYNSKLDLLEGVSYINKNGNSDLVIEYVIYKNYINEECIIPNSKFSTDFPSDINGELPDLIYYVKYILTDENGFTDVLWRTYRMEVGGVVKYENRLLLGDEYVSVQINNTYALEMGDYGLMNMVIDDFCTESVHLFDGKTLLNALRIQLMNGVTSSKYRYGTIWILDSEMNAVIGINALTVDQIAIKGNNGIWSIVPLPVDGAPSTIDLMKIFLGTNPVIDLKNDQWVLFSQNIDVNNVRKFGLLMWTSYGSVRDNMYTPDVIENEFNQADLLNNNSLSIINVALDDKGEIVETKKFTIIKEFLSTTGEKYEITYDDDSMWQGSTYEGGSYFGNTNFRFYPEQIHIASKKYVIENFDNFNVCMPFGGLVLILDANKKVVGIRANIIGNLYFQKQIILFDNEYNYITNMSDIPLWGAATYSGYEVCNMLGDIEQYIPDGGYVVAVCINASFLESLFYDVVFNADSECPSILEMYFYNLVKIIL